MVLALGTRFRSDDGIGPHVLGLLAKALGQDERIELLIGADDALAIIAAWEGQALTVVIDAAAPGVQAGRISRLEHQLDLNPNELAGCSSHGLGLAEAIRLGQLLGRMPQRLVVYAVEAASIDPGTALSAAVRAAATTVCNHVLRDLETFRDEGDADTSDAN